MLTISGAQIAVRRFGDPSAPALLLLHGLALTIEDWPPPFIAALVAAGRQVVAIDHRDIGKSSRWTHRPSPRPLIAWAFARLPLPRGLKPQMPYALADMAADAMAVMDSLQIERFDIVGVSMGGMIAQRVALAAPDRVASLSLIMTSSNAPRLPLPDAAVRKLMARPPRASDLSSMVAYMQDVREMIAAPRDQLDRAELRGRVARAAAYGHPPQAGARRQLAAIVSDARRWRHLHEIKVPAVVIHGACDLLLPLQHGRDLAKRLGNARLLVVAHMGHEILPSNQSAVLAAIRAHLSGHRSEQGDEELLAV
jgi:pimeloyl-ACP methyl ester carboxylesterase